MSALLRLVHLWIALLRDLKVESYLVFADSAAANLVNGKGWASLAAKEFSIATQVITLSSDVIDTIKETQRKQDIRIADCEMETA